MKANITPRYNERVVLGGAQTQLPNEEEEDANADDILAYHAGRNTKKLQELELEPLPLRRALIGNSRILSCTCGKQEDQNCRHCGIMCCDDKCTGSPSITCYCLRSKASQTYDTVFDIKKHKGLEVSRAKQPRFKKKTLYCDPDETKQGTCYFKDGFGAKECHIDGCV
jgi:hypothetical protein